MTFIPMKTKLPLVLAITSVLGASLAGAQEGRPPQPPPPEGERPPGPPPEGSGRPGERAPGRPDPERGPNRPDGERGPGRPEGGRRSEGDRPFGPRGEYPNREGVGREGRFARPQKPTPYLGVMTAPLPAPMASQLGVEEGFGLVVEEVVPDSPAASAGVQRYDVLKMLDDQRLVDPNQLASLVRSRGKDTEVNLTLLRKGQEQKVTIKIGERMLPERRGFSFPSPGEFIPRFDELRDRGEDFARRMQEHVRAFQERMREFQKKLEEWQKNPQSGPPPEAPKLENPNPPGAQQQQNHRRPEPRPSDLLREVRPGGAPQVRVDQEGNVTTWNTGEARVRVKDENGEVEVRSENGHRTVTAKDNTGETVFTGPIDTEEQRRSLPEPVRRSLEKIRVQSQAGGPRPPEPGRDAPSIESTERALRNPPAPPAGPREIQ